MNQTSDFPRELAFFLKTSDSNKQIFAAARKGHLLTEEKDGRYRQDTLKHFFENNSAR